MIIVLLFIFLVTPAWGTSYEVYFANGGIPATGLTPSWITLKVRSDGSDVGSPPTFSSVGGGWYKYTASPGSGVIWVGVIDGGSSLDDADRYVPVRLAPEDVNLDRAVSLTALESGGNVEAAKAAAESSQTAAEATDARLPIDPASNTQVNTRAPESGGNVEAGKTAAESADNKLPAIPASQGDVTTVGSAVAGVQADTDNLQTRIPTALVSGRMDASVGDIPAAALALLFMRDSGKKFADAIAGSLVKEIADNAGGGDPFALPTSTAYSAGTFGKLFKDMLTIPAHCQAGSGYVKPTFIYPTVPIQSRGITSTVVARHFPSYVKYECSLARNFGSPETTYTYYNVYYYNADGTLNYPLPSATVPNP